MSISALKPALSAARADGHITLEEAKNLTNPQNGLGTVIDKDEFEIFTRLANDIKKSEPASLPAAEKLAEVNAKNKTRLVNKGVKIAGITAAVVSVVGGVAAMALIGVGGFFAVAAIPVFVALAVGVGALAGFIRSRTNPISAEDIKNKTPIAVEAENYTQNPGVKTAGKIGLASVGILGIGGLLGNIGFAVGFGSGLGGVGAALGVGVLASSGFIGIPVLIGLTAVVGIGALVGYIYNRVRQNRLKDIPKGEVTASPEAKALIDEVIAKGPTAKDQVQTSSNTGAKVGKIISGVIVGLWGVATIGGAVIGGEVAAAIWIAGLAFVPVGFACLAIIGVATGIGALVGYVKSRSNKD